MNKHRCKRHEFQGMCRLTPRKLGVVPIVSLAYVLILCFGCADQSIGLDEAIEPTYAHVEQYILRPHCVACHQPRAQASFLDLSSPGAIENLKGTLHLSAFDSGSSSLYTRMSDTENPMPLTGLLTPSLQDLMKEWIDEGAVIDETSAPTGVIPEPNFCDLLEKTFEPHCARCHEASRGSASFLPLATSEDFINAQSSLSFAGDPIIDLNDASASVLIHRMRDAENPMPQSGLLPLEVVDVVETWISNGAFVPEECE